MQFTGEIENPLPYEGNDCRPIGMAMGVGEANPTSLKKFIFIFNFIF